MRLWIGIAFTLIFLYLVFHRLDLGALRLALTEADYYWIVPALLFYLAGYVVRIKRWQVLLQSIKNLPWRQLTAPLILGFTMNNVLPARAGEFIRAYIAGRQHGIAKSSAFGTVVMERLFDGVVMLLLALGVSFFYHNRYGRQTAFSQTITMVLLGTALVFGAALAIFISALVWREQWRAWLQKDWFFIPKSWRPLVRQASDSFVTGLGVLQRPRQTWTAFALTLAAWLGESAAYYFVLRAFHLAVPAWGAVLLMAVVNLGIMVPSSPGYIGPFEFFGVGTLLLFGIGKAEALPAVLVIHAMVWLPITLWGIYLMWTMKLSLKSMTRLTQETGAQT
jgi:hypothetical protein